MTFDYLHQEFPIIKATYEGTDVESAINEMETFYFEIAINFNDKALTLPELSSWYVERQKGQPRRLHDLTAEMMINFKVFVLLEYKTYLLKTKETNRY